MITEQEITLEHDIVSAEEVSAEFLDPDTDDTNYNEPVSFVSAYLVWFRICNQDIKITKRILPNDKDCFCSTASARELCNTKFIQMVTVRKQDGSKELLVNTKSVIQAIYGVENQRYFFAGYSITKVQPWIRPEPGQDMKTLLIPPPHAIRKPRVCYIKSMAVALLYPHWFGYENFRGRKTRHLTSIRFGEFKTKESMREFLKNLKLDTVFAERARAYLISIMRPSAETSEESSVVLTIEAPFQLKALESTASTDFKVTEPIAEAPEPVVAEEVLPIENVEAFSDQQASREAKINEFQKALAIREEILPQIAEDIASLESQMKELSEKLAKRQEDQEKAQALVDKVVKRIQLYLK